MMKETRLNKIYKKTHFFQQNVLVNLFAEERFYTIEKNKM